MLDMEARYAECSSILYNCKGRRQNSKQRMTKADKGLLVSLQLWHSFSMQEYAGV